jgi:hypothetical protein
MLLRLFKGTGPGVIFLIVITMAAMWISPLLAVNRVSVFQYNSEPMPLYGLLLLLFGKNYLAGTIFSFAVVSAMAFLLVNFNTSVFFINERTFLPAFLYVIISGLFPECQELNPVLPASVFLILSIMRIMDGYRKQGTAYNFFDAGLLISAGSLFYGNLIWFGLLVIIGIALLRTGNISEIIISVLGLLTPYLLTFGIYYILGKDLRSLLEIIFNNLFGKVSDFSFSRVTIVVLIFLGILLLISMFQLIALLNTKKIKTRQTFSLLLWGILISAAAYFVIPSVSVEIFWITGIPASYLLTHYFIFVKKKLVPEIFLSGLFLLILLIQIINLMGILLNH